MMIAYPAKFKTLDAPTRSVTKRNIHHSSAPFQPLARPKEG